MISLDELGLLHGTDKASSTTHNYLCRYDTYFDKLRHLPIALLEIGVADGRSIRMWAEYFQLGNIYGVDTGNDFQTDNPNIHLYRGDQASPAFWLNFAVGKTFDIVIDDACHQADAQKVSFEALWKRLRSGGFYIIEDVWTWWDNLFDSAIDGSSWLLEIISDLNLHGKAYYGKPKPLDGYYASGLEATLDFVHQYPGLVILKKK